jgi:hypothetical protein
MQRWCIENRQAETDAQARGNEGAEREPNWSRDTEGERDNARRPVGGTCANCSPSIRDAVDLPDDLAR